MRDFLHYVYTLVDIDLSSTMAKMTAPIQLPPDIVQTTGGSGTHKHMKYIQSNINGYDQCFA